MLNTCTWNAPAMGRFHWYLYLCTKIATMKLPAICLLLFLEITLLTAQQGTPGYIPSAVPGKAVGVTYPDFPSFKEIVTAFYKQYKGAIEPEFMFEKRPA